jgi:hypothetical protein
MHGIDETAMKAGATSYMNKAFALYDEAVRSANAGGNGGRSASRVCAGREAESGVPYTGQDGFFDGFLDDYFMEADEHLSGAKNALLAVTR